MKAPVTLDQLTDEWSKDSVIDMTELSKESIKVPTLHAKYLRVLSYHRLVVQKTIQQYNEMKSWKVQYYSGNLNNPEDLAKYNIEPLSQKVDKRNIQVYLDTDQDLNALLTKRMINEEIVFVCESIIKEIASRSFQISNAVKWEMFLQGK